MQYLIVKSSKAGKEDYCSVYARVRAKEINKKYALGFFIKISEWENYNSQKYDASAVMESIGIKYGMFANTLEQIKFELEEHFDPKTASKTIEAIKESVLGALIKTKKKKKRFAKPMFSDFLKECIDDFTSGKRIVKDTGKPMSKARIAKYKANLKAFQHYEDQIGEQIALDDIDMDFQREYVQWLNECGWHINTISSHMKDIRYIMSLAYEDKLTRNDIHLSSDFSPKGEIVDHVYLTPDQIQQLADFDISSREKITALIEQTDYEDPKRKDELLQWLTDIQAKHMDESKDIFLVGCYTGQRFSDYSRMNKNMVHTVNGQKFICIIQKKTGKKVLIPFDLRVKAILKKYKGELPQLQDHELNRNIKIIGELIGWTYKANIDESRMGAKSGLRFCDMISSHTARRSFATNAYAAGVPLSSIMAVTGHSREEKLRIYLKLQAEDKALIAAKEFKGVLNI